MSEPRFYRVDRRYWMFADPKDKPIGERLSLGRPWEPYSQYLFERAIPPGSAFLDLGAHIGEFTVPASRWVGEGGWVYAWEPIPKSFSMLRKSINRNGVKNARPYRLALGASSARTRMCVSRTNTGANTFGVLGEKGEQFVEVGVVTFDLWWRAFCSFQCLRWGRGEKALWNDERRRVFVKLDVEGAEVGVLLGMRDFLRTHQNVTMLVELFPQNLLRCGQTAETLVRLLGEKLKFHLSIVDPSHKKLRTTSVSRLLEEEIEDRPGYVVNLWCERGVSK